MIELIRRIPLGRLTGLTTFDLLIKILMAVRNINDGGRQSSTRPTDDWVDIIRSSFAFVKQRLLVFINALDDVAFSPVLDFYELLPAITSTNDSEKVDRIIGTVIQKGNVACNKFLDCLIAKDILTYEEIKDFKVKRLPAEIIQKFEWLSIEIFIQADVQRYLEGEIEIFFLLDSLYEWHLIELSEHDNIRNTDGRLAKVKKLLSIMNAKMENSLFMKFCHILNMHRHERVVDWLHHYITTTTNDESIWMEDIDASFGSTMKVKTSEDTEHSLEQHHINDMNNQLQENGSIVDVRSGCVEFILLSQLHGSSKENQQKLCMQFLQLLIKMPDVNSTLKPGQSFKVALRRCYMDTPLLNEFGKPLLRLKDDIALKICRPQILEQMDVSATLSFLENNQLIQTETIVKLKGVQDEKLKKEFIYHILAKCSIAKLQELLSKSKESTKCKYINDFVEERKCLECYRYSICQSKQDVMDEIDTDMISATLKGQQQVPKFIIEFCVERANTTSRADRARLFLDFILIKGELLTAFAEVLATRSNICIKCVKCKQCIEGSSRRPIESTGKEKEEETDETEGGKEKEKNEKYDFYFKINDIGELTVENPTEEHNYKAIDDEQHAIEHPGHIGEDQHDTKHQDQGLKRTVMNRTRVSSYPQELPPHSLERFIDFLTKTTDHMVIGEIKDFTAQLLHISSLSVEEEDDKDCLPLERRKSYLYLLAVIEQQGKIRKLEKEIDRKNKHV